MVHCVYSLFTVWVGRTRCSCFCGLGDVLRRKEQLSANSKIAFKNHSDIEEEEVDISNY